MSIEVVGDRRVIRANGVPTHQVGKFPNGGNPHAITEQRYDIELPARGTLAAERTKLGNHNFGFALNGVPFDPGAAEFYLGDRNGGWQYEALAGAVGLGIDANHAHVQPTGAYHYHGLPVGLIDELGIDASRPSPVLGWAADGFPIFALYARADPSDPKSAVEEQRPSYVLREGQRPGGEGQPGGAHDGTFTADYRFDESAGNLDECNGRVVVTPEFPDGTYAYFLTREWPVIPRCFAGTPEPSVIARGPGGPGGGPGARRGRRGR